MNQKDFRKHQKFVIWSIIVSSIVFCFVAVFIPIIFYVNNVNGILNLIIIVSYAVLLLLMTLYVLQFMLAGLALQSRFKMLNNKLR